MPPGVILRAMERALDTTEASPATDGQCASCVDVVTPFQPRLLRVVLAGGGACGATMVISELLHLPKPIEYFLFGLALYAGFIVHERLVARHARRALQSLPPGPDNTTVDWQDSLRLWALRAAGASPIGVALMPTRAAIGAAAAFVANQADAPRLVRLTSTTGPAPALAAALEAAIEPTLLQSRDPAFWETFSSVPKPTVAHRLAAIPRAYGPRLTARIFMVASLGLAAIGFVVLGMETVRSLSHGAMPPMVVQIGAMCAAGAIFIVVQRWRTYTWFAVHGGLVIAEAVWYRTARRLVHFTPADSVLLYWPETHQLAVARRGGHGYARHVQPPEAEAAIAAWLSPLPCPPLEQFSDLR